MTKQLIIILFITIGILITPLVFITLDFNPTRSELTEQDKARMRMQEIESELKSMDYLTSKELDGEDMTEYGNYKEKRMALREEYRTLESVANKQS